MRANHIPASERLQARIHALQAKQEAAHVPSGGGNPYWRCSQCGITDPQLSVDGNHFDGCPLRGVDKQIAHYKRLLENI